MLTRTTKNPRRRVSRKARRFIGRKVRQLAHEGYPAPQRVAIAYSEARRRKGYRVPKRGRRNPADPVGVSESLMWRAVKTDVGRIRSILSGRTGGNVELILKELERTARIALGQLSVGVHKNPAIAVLGNPGGKLLSRRLTEVRYQHATDGKFYRHTFGPGTSVYLLPDGAVLLKGRKRLWKDF